MSWRMFRSAGLFIPASTKIREKRPPEEEAATTMAPRAAEVRHRRASLHSPNSGGIFRSIPPGQRDEVGRKGGSKPPFVTGRVSARPKTNEKTREIDKTRERRDPEGSRPVGAIGERQPAPGLRKRKTRRQRDAAKQAIR